MARSDAKGFARFADGWQSEGSIVVARDEKRKLLAMAPYANEMGDANVRLVLVSEVGFEIPVVCPELVKTKSTKACFVRCSHGLAEKRSIPDV